MKGSWLLLLSVTMFFAASAAQANFSPKTIEGMRLAKELAPKGYALETYPVSGESSEANELKSAEDSFAYGDLNRDGQKDIAGIYRRIADSQVSELGVNPGRALLHFATFSSPSFTRIAGSEGTEEEGERLFVVFLGNAQGAFREIVRSKYLIRGDDEREGGWLDPAAPSVNISFDGGLHVYQYACGLGVGNSVNEVHQQFIVSELTVLLVKQKLVARAKSTGKVRSVQLRLPPPPELRLEALTPLGCDSMVWDLL